MSACTWMGGNKPPKTGAEEPVLDANFLVLLSGPAQFLIDVAGGYERAVGWCNTL